MPPISTKRLADAFHSWRKIDRKAQERRLEVDEEIRRLYGRIHPAVLASRTGLTQTILSGAMRGRARLGPHAIAKVLAALGTPVEASDE